MAWGLIAGLLKDVIGGVVKDRAMKAELKVERHIATVERIRQGDEQAAKLDEISVASRGWKDEYLLLITTTPLILCFIPGWELYISAGFNSLRESVPEWYMYALAAVYVDTLGFRRILRGAMEKWLTNKVG